MKFCTRIVMTFLAGAAYTTTASAQDTSPVIAPEVDEQPGSALTGIFALGGAMTPAYEGSSKLKARPFLFGNVNYRGLDIRVVGPALVVNVMGDSHFEFGPIIGMTNGRDREDGQGAVALLDEVKTSLRIGAYAGYHFGGNENGQGRILFALQATKIIKSGYGFSIDPSISYAAIRGRKASLSFDLGARFSDSKAMKTVFGITSVEAARSGLSAFAPGSGISQVSAGATATYRLTRHWGLIGRAQGGTYVSDAADSPIVEAGSKTFGIFALGVSYSF